MDEKEIAKYLIDKFGYGILSTLVVLNKSSVKEFCAKKCAIISVDAIIKEYKEIVIFNCKDEIDAGMFKRQIAHWGRVKKEIENL